MWRHNDVIGRNEYLISTWSESTVPWVYSLQFVIHPCDRRTDGRTDGRATAYTRYSIYAVARKNANRMNCGEQKKRTRNWHKWARRQRSYNWKFGPALVQLAMMVHRDSEQARILSFVRRETTRSRPSEPWPGPAEAPRDDKTALTVFSSSDFHRTCRTETPCRSRSWVTTVCLMLEPNGKTKPWSYSNIMKVSPITDHLMYWCNKQQV